MYEWAHFRRAKGAVKLHLRLDHDGYLPDYALITEGKRHDSMLAKAFPYSPKSITVFDKAYVDFGLFGKLCSIGAFFVTRLKDNADYSIVEKRAVPWRNTVINDWLVHFNGHYSRKKCPHTLRIVEFYDEERDRVLRFLTNNLTLAASTIAAIYKERWAIEIFFKALKQSLKIKTFIGTISNAVKTQIWTALIAMLLLKYLQLKSSIGWSLSNLVALLRMNLFTYRDLWAWLDNPYITPPQPLLEVEQIALTLQ